MRRLFLRLYKWLISTVPVCSLWFPDAYFVFLILRLESSFRSFSRPVLHAAAKVVQEMGKSRAAAYALGTYDEGATLQAYSDNAESLDSDLQNPMAEGRW
jgi:hypothetical protein